MKQILMLFFKLIILLSAVGVLISMIIFPQTEGRAKYLDLINIYIDPVILYIYLASIPFFVALYQAFKLLGYIEQNNTYSQISVKALRNIKYCALILIGSIIAGEFWLIFGVSGDDKTGPIALGVYTTFVLIVVSTTVAVFERKLQNAVNIKSGNGLIV